MRALLMGDKQDFDVCAAKGRGMLLRENAAGGTGRGRGVFGGPIGEMETGR